MKLPNFLRNSKEDQPEADIPEEESLLAEAASPEGEAEESAPDMEPETVSEGEVLEEPIEASAEPVEEQEPESTESVEGSPLTPVVEEAGEPEEVESPSPEPEVGELPPTEELPPASEPSRPSWPRRFIAWLFNKETRVGRTMRQLAILVGVFGLGLLFAGIVWVRPQANRAESLARERQQAFVDLTAAKDARQSVEAELADAQTALATAQDETALLEARVHLAKTAYQAAKAQLAIVEKQGADALEALDAAKAEAAALNEYLADEDPDVATEIEARLTAAKSALVRDSDLALSDLETLITLLMQQDKILIGK